MPWDQKCLGRSRVVRRDLSTNSFYKEKLDLLANSCDLPPLTLGALIASKLLDLPSFVHQMQKLHNQNSHYWIDVEQSMQGDVIYKLNKSGGNIVTKANKSRYLDMIRDKQIKLSISNEHDHKLSLLSRSCGFKRAEMLAIMLHFGLDSSNVVMYFQDIYNKEKHYWVTPFEENGIVSYLLTK
jgi:hypothetical protein